MSILYPYGTLTSFQKSDKKRTGFHNIQGPTDGEKKQQIKFSDYIMDPIEYTLF